MGGGDINKQRKIIGRLCRENDCVLIGCFSPCDDLAVCGTRHFEKKALNDSFFWVKAMRLFWTGLFLAEYFDIPYFCENPKSMITTFERKPEFKFNPCDFGQYLPPDHKHCLYPDIYPGQDSYNKDTWIWYGNGFRPPVKKPVNPVNKDYPGWKKLGGKSDRTKEIRSVTPEGFSIAVYDSNKRLIF